MPIQTRRSVSISGPTYKRLKDNAQVNGKSMSGIVEALVKDFLNSEDRKRKIEMASEGDDCQQSSAHFSF